MCGICGVLAARGDSSLHNGADVVGAMTSTLAHRGPDDRGVWSDAEAGVALGHSRLSIIDLSPTGHQPMSSPGERFMISFNGEIYNYRELRHEIVQRGVKLRGASDTEVLLAGFEEWGIAQTLQRATGMFAFGVWDRLEHRLTLGRDRFGEKPLYYGWQGNALLFGSELKAVRAHPEFRGEIDRDALSLLFRFNYIPAPYSIYRGIRKLVPGTTLTIDPSKPGFLPEPVPYWRLRDAALRGQSDPIRDENAAETELDGLLRDAIARQMIADVPLGAFLSGGVDSSTIVALMQAQSERRVKTFTIGFNEAAFSEADDARAVARHLGTDHTDLIVTPRDAMEVIPDLPRMYDEPYADSSQIPTHLVSRLARQHVTVALSGDGGDELFGGYNRYFIAPRIWNRVAHFPGPMRSVAADVASKIPGTMWDSIAGVLSPILSNGARRVRLGEKMKKVVRVLRSTDGRSVYDGLVTVWPNPLDLVPGADAPGTLIERSDSWLDLGSFESQMMYLDLLTYLPDDILAKVDRAAMRVSLETRVPFLDHRVVEFACRLPLSMKIQGGVGKHLLRRVLYRYVPRELIERPKMGFGIPVGEWIRGPLRDWSEDLLSEKRLAESGLLDPAPIRRMWQDHLAGRADGQFALWGVLMLQAWLDATTEAVASAV